MPAGLRQEKHRETTMAQRKLIGCAVILLGALLLTIALPSGLVGLVWFIHNLIQWGYIPQWLVALSGLGLALGFPLLAVLIVLLGLLLLLGGSRRPRG